MKKLNEYAATLLLILLLIMALCGCSQKWKVGKCTQWGVCKTVKDSTVIHVKDSTYYVPIPISVNGDTAWMKLLFECDSVGTLWLRSSETWQGRYIDLQKQIDAGHVTVIATQAPRIDTVFSTVTVHDSIAAQTIVQNIETNKLTWWQRFMVISGYVGWGLTVILIAYFIYRIIKKLK